MTIPELPRAFPRNALATTIVLTFVGAVAWVLTSPFPEPNVRIIYFLLGQLSSFVGMIVSFHFSSTERESLAEEAREKSEHH